MWAIRALLVIVLVVVIVGFSVLNSEERVTVQLHDTTYYNIPLIVVTYWSFVAGMLITFVLGLSYFWKLSLDLRDTRRDNRRLLSELTALRNRPIEALERLDLEEGARP
jgi:uncharacterized integral membrane protein